MIIRTGTNRMIITGPGPLKIVVNHPSLEEAVRHYETEDIPESQVIDMISWHARNGDARATMWLAHFALEGRCSVPKDPVQAQAKAKTVIAEVSNLAQKGDTQAEFLLGAAYREGLAVDTNLDQAQIWYTKAAASGEITANYNLGMLFKCGCVPPDINKSREYFTQAAKLGSKRAISVLEQIHDNGKEAQFETLRKNTLVQVLGMQLLGAIETLTKNGLISDPKAYMEETDAKLKRYVFRFDGIIMETKQDGRVTSVEGHAKDSLGPQQFKGTVPFDVTWNATDVTVKQVLGESDDLDLFQSGHTESVMYRIRNVNLVLFFSSQNSDKLKFWRVFEMWPVNYDLPMPPPETNSIAVPTL